MSSQDLAATTAVWRVPTAGVPRSLLAGLAFPLGTLEGPALFPQAAALVFQAVQPQQILV